MLDSLWIFYASSHTISMPNAPTKMNFKKADFLVYTLEILVGKLTW